VICILSVDLVLYIFDWKTFIDVGTILITLIPIQAIQILRAARVFRVLPIWNLVVKKISYLHRSGASASEWQLSLDRGAAAAAAANLECTHVVTLLGCGRRVHDTGCAGDLDLHGDRVLLCARDLGH